jgi:hypothetical protein
MDNQKQGSKQYRYEPLKNFSIARVCFPDKGKDIRCNNTSYNQIHCSQQNEEKTSDDDPASITNGVKLQKQKSTINLTEDEKLQLQFVLTAQNCADCGLW